MSERLLDWRSLLRDPSLFDTLDERPRLVQKYSWALPTDEALDVVARYQPIVEMGAGGGYWAHI